MNNTILRAMSLRKSRGEDITAILKTYKNLSIDEMNEYLVYFDLPLIEEPLEDIRQKKISSLSSMCHDMIEHGVDVEIDGTKEHFSYSIEKGDQGNIDDIFNLANATKLSQPYHADGGACKLYTPEQIMAIYVAQKTNKTVQETWFNQIKQYILSCNDKEEIKGIEYGQPLTGVYLENYNAILAQAQEIINAVIGGGN